MNAQDCKVLDFDGPRAEIRPYDVFTGQTNGVSSGCNSDIDGSLSATTFNWPPASLPNSDFNVTRVRNGFDDQVEIFVPGFYLERTRGGSARSMRLNQNRGYLNPPIFDEREVDIFRKRFTAVNDTPVELYFAAVMEYDYIDADHELPYFIAKLSSLDNGDVLDVFCFEANVDDPGLIIAEDIYPAYEPAHTLVVRDWDLVSLELPAEYIGHNLELILETGDCNESIHGGYVYVDDISYCGIDIEDFCANMPSCAELEALLEVTQTNADCLQFELPLPDYPAACLRATIDWGDDTFTLTTALDGDTLFHTYAVEGNYAVDIVIENLETGEVCSIRKIADANCEPDPVCRNCEFTAREIIGSLNLDNSSGCLTEATVFVPLTFDECFTGTIYWGDGTSDDLVPGEMGYVYTGPDGSVRTVRVEIQSLDGTRCAEESYKFQVLTGCPPGAIQEVTLVPNPSNANQDIQILGLETGSAVSVEIYDVYGVRRNLIQLRGDTFNVGALPSGIYFLKISTPEATVSKKLVIK